MFTTTTMRDTRSAGLTGLPVGALSGVRRRRVAAVAVDLVLVTLAVAALWTALIVLTLGVALVVLPPLFPIVALVYAGATVSGPAMATPGMRLFDLEMRLDATGGRPRFADAALHAALLYVSWTVPVALLVARDKRCLHDMLAGMIVVRRL